MSARLSPAELRAWENFQTVAEVLHREVGRELWADAQLSDADFTVLAHLRLAGEPVRPSECARSIGWDSSRLSHQLRRLERRGLVAKVAGDLTDGRATLIEATPEGSAAHRKAVGPHLRAAQAWFAQAMTESQVDDLNEILDALLAHVRGRVGTPTTGDHEEARES